MNKFTPRVERLSKRSKTWSSAKKRAVRKHKAKISDESKRKNR